MINWSHSQQVDCDFCIRCWYIKKHQKQLNVWVPIPHYFVFGKIIHEIMWKFRFPYQGEQQPGSKIDLRNQWEKAFQAGVQELRREVQFTSGSAGSNYEKSQARRNLGKFEGRERYGLKMLMQHYRKASALPLPWKREDRFAIALGQGGPVQYWVVLDRLYSDGTVEDIKTGKKAKITASIRKQLLGYRAAVQRQYNFPWARGNVILHLPTHKYISERLLQREWGKLSEELVVSALCVNALLKRVRQGESLDRIFLYHPDMSVCEICQFYFPCREKGLMVQRTLFSMSGLYGDGRRTVAIEPRFAR